MPRTDLWWRCYHRCFVRIYHRQSDTERLDGELAALVDAALERTGAAQVTSALCDEVVSWWRAAA